jgi:hypothetical protein
MTEKEFYVKLPYNPHITLDLFKCPLGHRRLWGSVSNWANGPIEQVQLRFILRRGLDDFRSASSTASAVETGEGGFGAIPQQSNQQLY